MPKAAATYADLDETLRSLGFTARTVEGKARIYRHPSGASVYLPDTALDRSVQSHHLELVGAVLREYDIDDPTDSLAKLQRAT